VNFVVQLFQSAITLGVGLAVLALVYSHTEELNGWSQSELLCVLGIGALLLYCFWLVMATGAFWVVNMWFLAELFEGVYQTGRWPIGVYPGWLRYSMTYLVPIGFAVTVPAQALTDRLEWETVVIALGFAALVAAFTRWFWRFGLKRYSGASA
jgi:ABC-2 type transport system permease protein